MHEASRTQAPVSRADCVCFQKFCFEGEFLDVYHNLQVRFVTILLDKRNISIKGHILGMLHLQIRLDWQARIR